VGVRVEAQFVQQPSRLLFRGASTISVVVVTLLAASLVVDLRGLVLDERQLHACFHHHHRY